MDAYAILSTHIQSLSVESAAVKESIVMVVAMVKKDGTVPETLRLLNADLDAKGEDLVKAIESGYNVVKLEKKLEFGHALFLALAASN